MLSPGAALVGAGLGTKVALVTDGRFSGASHGKQLVYMFTFLCNLFTCFAWVRTGIMIGHVTPEAFDGGPIALVRNEDSISIDIQNRKLDLVRL